MTVPPNDPPGEHTRRFVEVAPGSPLPLLSLFLSFLTIAL